MRGIGSVVALQGDVQAVSDTETRALAMGDQVHEGETLTTGTGASVEIKFTDGSILAQGPDAAMVLDEYVYDQNDASACGQLFDAATGTFRMVTGAIAEANPEAVEIKTPLATIGIRGTGMDVIAREGLLKVGVFDYHQFDVVITTSRGTTFITDGNLIVEVYPDGTFSEPRPYTELEQLEIRSLAPLSGYGWDSGQGEDTGEDAGAQEDDDRSDGQKGEEPDSPEDPEQEGVAQLTPDPVQDPDELWQPQQPVDQPAGGPVPAPPAFSSGLADGGLAPAPSPFPFTPDDDDDNADPGGQDQTGAGNEPPPISWDFIGTDGNDTFVGTAENEYISGGGGNDSLMGGGGDDYIQGGADTDTLLGGDGDDTIAIESGDPQTGEIIQGGTGNNVLHVLSNPADFSQCAINLGEFSQIVIESGQTASFDCSQISAADLEIRGGPGSNLAIDSFTTGIIDGSKLDFSSSQGMGLILGSNISIVALDATHMPESGPLRIQHMSGSLSNMTIMVAAPAGGTVDVARCFEFSGETPPMIQAVFDGHHGLLLGSGDGEYLGGHDHDDSIMGGGGDDTLFGGKGGDTLFGGEGEDWYDAGDPWGTPGTTTGVLIDLSSGTATDFMGDTDFIQGVENVSGGSDGDTIIGDGQANKLVGNDGYDCIRGGEGHDTLYGNFGEDSLYGDEGNDWLDGGEHDDIIFGGTGDDTILGGDGDDLLSGEDGNDCLVGSAPGNNSMYGGEGDDTLVVFANNDLVDGGNGYDVLQIYQGTLDLSSTLATHFRNMDQIDLGPENHAMVKLEEVDITGGTDADTLTVTGGDGDSLVVDDGFWTFTQVNAQGFFVLESTGGATLIIDPNIGYVHFANTPSGLNITGTPTAETIQGTPFDDILQGMGGNDTLYGKDGDDQLDGGNGADWLDGGEGDDEIFDNGIAGADGDDTILGGDGDDLISLQYGSIDTDSVLGGDGDDTIEAGSGYDEIHGGQGDDYLSFDAATTGMLLTMGDGGSGIYSIDGYIQRYWDMEGVIGSSHGDTLRGNSGDNTLYGQDGDDELFGGDGDDYLFGGDGDDTLTISQGADDYHGGQGLDLLSFDNQSTPVNLSLNPGGAGVFFYNGETSAYSGIEGVIGTWDNDNLTGNSGDNLLMGQGGIDVINGGDGDDTLYGGDGLDALNGGAGADIYYYKALGEGGDSILSFDDGQDIFAFNSSVFDSTAQLFNAAIGGYDGSNGSFGSNDAAFLFDTANNELWYDSNGDLAGGNELIATISGSVTIDDTDIDFFTP